MSRAVVKPARRSACRLWIAIKVEASRDIPGFARRGGDPNAIGGFFHAGCASRRTPPNFLNFFFRGPPGGGPPGFGDLDRIPPPPPPAAEKTGRALPPVDDIGVGCAGRRQN